MFPRRRRGNRRSAPVCWLERPSGELLQREFDLLRRWHLVMPFHAIFDERHTFSFDRVGDDAARTALTRRDERVIERGVIMTVAGNDLPTERAPAVGER